MILPKMKKKSARLSELLSRAFAFKKERRRENRRRLEVYKRKKTRQLTLSRKERIVRSCERNSIENQT